MKPDTLPSLLARARGSLFYRDRPIAYTALERESAQIANALRGLGLKAGDRLAVWLPNAPAWLAICFACARLGAIVVAVNTRFKSHEVADIIARSRCRLLVYWPGFRKIDFDSILDGCDADALRTLEGIIAYTEDGAALNPIQDKPMYRYSALQKEAPLAEDESRPDADCIIFTTSGTSKAPKFVLHSQQAIARHATDVAAEFGYAEPGAAVLITVPLCGAFGFCNAVAAIAAGSPLVMYPTFDAEEAAVAVRRHAITHTHATDEMFAQMLNATPDPRPFPSVRFFGYAALSPALPDFAAQAESRGLKLVGLYGSSEMQGLFASQDEDQALPDRVVPGGVCVSAEAQVRARDPQSGSILAHHCPESSNSTGQAKWSAISRMSRPTVPPPLRTDGFAAATSAIPLRIAALFSSAGSGMRSGSLALW